MSYDNEETLIPAVMVVAAHLASLPKKTRGDAQKYYSVVLENLREINAEMLRLRAEVSMFRKATTRIIAGPLDPEDCTHNIEIDPDTGKCGTCGEVLP